MKQKIRQTNKQYEILNGRQEVKEEPPIDTYKAPTTKQIVKRIQSNIKSFVKK